MNYLPILTRFWLSEKEAKIYLDLLENGNSRVSNIAKRLGLHRVELYRVLPGLITKGLALRSVFWKTTTYVAANPEKLESLLEDIRQGFSAVLPKLQEKFNQKKKDDHMVIYEWAWGIEQLYNEIVMDLPKGSTYYRYSSRTDDQRMHKNTYEKYKKIRIEKQIQRLVIMSESGRKYKWSDSNRGIAVVPSRFDAFDDNFQKIIFGNKMALVDIAAARAYVIENADLARFETKLFKFMYKFLKEYEKE